MHTPAIPTYRTALLVILLMSALSGCSQPPRYPSPPMSGGDVAIDIATLPEEAPRFFTVQRGKSAISFFVVRLDTGVQSFFDACVSCYAKKMGYASEEGRVVCRACGTSYSIFELDKGIGGCYPIQLKGRIEDGIYRIPLEAIFSEASKF